MGQKTVGLVCALALMCGCDSAAPSMPGPSDAKSPAPVGNPTEVAEPAAPSLHGKQTRSVFGAAGLEGSTLVCFYTEEDATHPAAMIEHRLETTEGVDTLHARLTLDPKFVDNTYGDNAIGWEAAATGKKPKPREFEQLVGSDHAVLRMLDANGKDALELKLDYVSEDQSVPSGYASLGVSGGDGDMVSGDPSFVLDAETSIERNFNAHGYDSFLESSPDTDDSYTVNPAAPDWEYLVVYDAWVDLDAFEGGFGDAHVDFIHASPSKTGNNTVTVVRERCPPEVLCSAPDGCDQEPPAGCESDSDCPEAELCFAFECRTVSVD